MNFSVKLLSAVCLVGLVWSATEKPSIRVGSFNIQTFGKTKMSKEVIPQILAEIVSRYDFLLIQEIKDTSGLAIMQLFDLVISLNPEFAYVISNRLGRSSYKEQYAYFYRTDRVYIESTYQYEDGPDDGTDLFAREPFCALIRIKHDIHRFAVCGIHIEPNQVSKEMNGLVLVHKDVKSRWSTPNILFTGDFNADGSYLTRTEEGNLLMKKDEQYLWVIGSDADTTTKLKSDNAYDRIIIVGKELQDAVVPGSGIVYRFDLDRETTLTESEAYAVSDHYPVEVSLNFYQ